MYFRADLLGGSAAVVAAAMGTKGMSVLLLLPISDHYHYYACATAAKQGNQRERCRQRHGHGSQRDKRLLLALLPGACRLLKSNSFAAARPSTLL